MFMAVAALAMSGDVDGGVTCVATARDIAAGAHVSADLLEPVACRAGEPQPRGLRFDRLSRSVTAEHPLPAGTYLGRLLVSVSSTLPKGARLTLRSTSGPAVVERRVTTLQAARSGERVFVRDEGGHVFAVALILSGEAARAE